MERSLDEKIRECREMLEKMADETVLRGGKLADNLDLVDLSLYMDELIVEDIKKRKGENKKR